MVDEREPGRCNVYSSFVFMILFLKNKSLGMQLLIPRYEMDPYKASGINAWLLTVLYFIGLPC